MQPLPPPSYDRTKVFVYIPSHNGQIWCGCAGGLAQTMAAGRAGGMSFLTQGSAINQVRNRIASVFLKSQFDVLVCIDADIEFTVKDFDFLMEGPELIATAEYVRKMEEYKPITFGMGFVRIHRKVFEALDNLTNGDGEPLVHHYRDDGDEMRDYFRTGASSDGRWMAEDFGFWSLVDMAGIKPKIEKRTRLKHWGSKAYAYVGDADFAGAN